MRHIAIMLLFGLSVPIHAADKAALQKLFTSIPPARTKPAREREYRFSIDYINADSRGGIASTQRVIGTYTIMPASGATKWIAVSAGEAPGAPADIAATEHQRYMEGMHYDRSAKPFSPQFFAGFPPQATAEKNLVWDTWMFDEFIGGYFDKLKPNQPIPFVSGDVWLGGTGSFHNKDVRLTWIGVSRMHGRDCALVRYEAFLNTFNTEMSGLKVGGRSEYWGEMWVALDSRTLEYATLREEVVGTLSMQNGGTRPIHVLRVGNVEPSRPD